LNILWRRICVNIINLYSNLKNRSKGIFINYAIRRISSRNRLLTSWIPANSFVLFDRLEKSKNGEITRSIVFKWWKIWRNAKEYFLASILVHLIFNLKTAVVKRLRIWLIASFTNTQICWTDIHILFSPRVLKTCRVSEYWITKFYKSKKDWQL
jgi:hypothetical protein